MSDMCKTVRLETAAYISIECKLSLEARCIYLLLVAESEGCDLTHGGKLWRAVYLDNAEPYQMLDKTFRAYLEELYKAGLYVPIDNNAWGVVRFT